MARPLSGLVTKRDGVLLRELAGESILLNLDDESYFGLDEVGTRMWRALVELRSLERVYDALLAEFEVEPALLRNDLGAFVDQLQAAGLIERHSE